MVKADDFHLNPLISGLYWIELERGAQRRQEEWEHQGKEELEGKNWRLYPCLLFWYTLVLKHGPQPRLNPLMFWCGARSLLSFFQG